MSKKNKSIWQKARESAEVTKNSSDTEKNDLKIKTIRKPRIIMGLFAGVINLLFWGLGSIILGKNIPINIFFFFLGKIILFLTYGNSQASTNLLVLWAVFSILFGVYGIYAGITNKEIIYQNSETYTKKKNWYSQRNLIVIFLFIIGIVINIYILNNDRLEQKSLEEINVEYEKNYLYEWCMADETELESGFFSGKSEQRIFCNCYVDLALSKWSLDEIIELDEMSNPPKEVFEFVDETWVCFAKKTVN